MSGDLDLIREKFAASFGMRLPIRPCSICGVSIAWVSGRDAARQPIVGVDTSCDCCPPSEHCLASTWAEFYQWVAGLSDEQRAGILSRFPFDSTESESDHSSYYVWHDHEGSADSEPTEFQTYAGATPEEVAEKYISDCIGMGVDEFEEYWQVATFTREFEGGPVLEFTVYLNRVTTVGLVAREPK